MYQVRSIAFSCDSEGNILPLGAPPPPQATAQPGDWTTFHSESQFMLADLLYHCAEVSASNVDALLDIWAQTSVKADRLAPFKSHVHIHATIDAFKLGDVSWQCFVTGYTGNVDDLSLEWMQTSYEVWYRDPDAVIVNMLANPYINLNLQGQCWWSNVMSGNIAWWHSISTQKFLHPNLLILHIGWYIRIW